MVLEKIFGKKKESVNRERFIDDILQNKLGYFELGDSSSGHELSKHGVSTTGENEYVLLNHLPDEKDKDKFWLHINLQIIRNKLNTSLNGVVIQLVNEKGYVESEAEVGDVAEVWFKLNKIYKPKRYMFRVKGSKSEPTP